MTAKMTKIVIVVLVLATVLLAGNMLIGSRANTKCNQAYTCCQEQTCQQCCCPQCCCPDCCCPDCCCDESCCLKTKDAAGCPAKQQKPCCAYK